MTDLAAPVASTPVASTPDRDGPLLGPVTLAQLERLQLSVSVSLAGAFAGLHRSPRRGSSLDFADHREYQPGDDVRRLDHHLFARFGTLYVKLFQAEEDLPLRLVVDTSASMAGEKLRTAARVAAALGFVALVRRDPVRLVTTPAGGPTRELSGRSAVPALFHALASMRAEGALELDSVGGALVRSGGPRGLTVVCSDLMTAAWAETVRHLRACDTEVAVVQVVSSDELHPTFTGDVDLLDAETGARVAISVSPPLLARYEAAVTGWLDDVTAATAGRGMAYWRLVAGDPVESLVLRAWRDAGLLR